MHLERIETLCLDFLRHASNPLTPVETLYEHCIGEGDVNMSLTLDSLLDFLRSHNEIIVVEGDANDLPVNAQAMETAGINLEPRAILKTRMPSRQELRDMFQQQLEQMRFHLREALLAAKINKDDKTMHELEKALERMNALEEKMNDFRL